MGYIHFLDDWSLISRQNLDRRMGKPRYVPEATLEDPLCEGTWDFPCVSRMPDTGKYIGLYGAAPESLEQETIDVPAGTDPGVRPRTPILCYAESDDGIHWTKPDLRGIAKFDAPVRAKNQVFGLPEGVEGGPAYFDPHDLDPNRRFKLLINYKPPNMGGHHGCRGLVVSPDGIHWTIAHEFRDQTATDTPTSVFYNTKQGHYTFNVRQHAGDRRVFFFHTKDWKNFSEPELVMHPDPMDPPLVGFYGMPTFEYEDIYIGLLWRIHCDPASNLLPNGAIDCDLAYSYDGRHFNRTFHRAFIDRNELGEHGGGCVYAGSMLIDESHNIRFYSGGSKAEHFQNQELVDAALMLHTMRLDGFMYLSTTTGRGRLRTRAFHITGDDLRINARAPWGGIRAQILDEMGEPIKGFTFDDCQPLQGDELFWRPRWSGGKSFGAAKNAKRRQLELDVVTGEVYAIRGDFQRLNGLWDPDLV